jgi:hypothetical protein
MRRAVVITGLIRDEATFARYLEDVFQLGRPELRVIFSSWTGELQRHPAIATLLARLGADVVEQPPPDLKLPGHMLHQTMALELALSLLDDDVFTLKTRPDICGVMDVVDFIALRPQSAPPGRLATPFGHRVHVVSMFGAHPLYINDIIFAGMAGDLRRLCWLPLIYGAKYPRLAPEQWLWATVLAPGNPVLDAYLAVNPGLLFNDPQGNVGLRDVLADSRLFARAIAVTTILMRDSLAYLHPDPSVAAITQACAAHTLEALLWDRLPIAGLDHHPTAAVNTFVSAGILAAIHDGAYGPSLFGEHVSFAMARYGGRGGRDAMQQDRTALAAEATALAAALSERVGLGAHQAPIDTPHRRRVARGLRPWITAETGASYAAGLETEINHLRRVVDQLQSQLKPA